MDSSEGYSGLQQWAAPLIFGRLYSAYGRMLPDQEPTGELIRLHARAWRALINGDMEDFGATRETLVVAIEGSGLTLDHLTDVDGEIMLELLDVVISRYNRSHRTARAYHLALMELAGRLQPARAAA